MILFVFLGILIMYLSYLLGQMEVHNEKLFHLLKIVLVLFGIVVLLMVIMAQYFHKLFIRSMETTNEQTKITKYFRNT